VSEQELERQAKHRLSVIRHAQEVTGSVARTCRYYGISRATYYRWYRRYEEKGVVGLRDRSTRPHACPHETPGEVVAKIIYLRQNYHFGPRKIEMYLKRYHDINVSVSGIWRILKRLDMNRLPVSQRYKRHVDRWKRYEKPQPGHQVQIDVKFIAPLKGSRKRYYQFTAIDDCTRLRVLRLYDRLNQKTAIQFVDYVLERLPFRVEAIQTDNGSEFQAGFHWHLLDRGIGHVYIKPRTPRLNGKVERSHRIDAEEFYRLLDGVVIDDAEVFNEKLQEWEHFYNYARPHGGLGGQTPYERLRQKTTSNVAHPRQSHRGHRTEQKGRAGPSGCRYEETFGSRPSHSSSGAGWAIQFGPRRGRSPIGPRPFAHRRVSHWSRSRGVQGNRRASTRVQMSRGGSKPIPRPEAISLA
jgi:transposase InsO family protein